MHATRGMGIASAIGRRAWLYLRAMRAFSFPLSAGPVLAATAVVLPPDEWQPDVLLASLMGVIGFHAAGNLLNDYFDFRGGVDTRAEDDAGRPGRLLVAGRLRPREVLAEALVCLTAGLVLSGWLAWRVGPEILGFAGVAALAGWAYTAPPLRLKRRALGELHMMLVFGPALMLGAAYAQMGAWRLDVLPLSVAAGVSVAAVLLGNNLRDMDEDAAAGVRTLAHGLGRRGATLLYTLMVVIAACMPAGLAALGAAPRALLAAPLLLVLPATTLRAMWAGRRLPAVDVATARFAAAVLAAVTLAYAFVPG